MSFVYELDHEVENKEKENSGYKSVLSNFCLSASINAVPKIIESRNIFYRIFWTICFLAFLALMIFFIVRVIQTYFSYPTAMDSNSIQQQPQYFPAFTFCNVGALRYDLFAQPFLNYTNMNNITNTNDTTTFTPLQARYVQSFIVNQINQNQSLDPYLFPLSSMLYQCSFNSVPCSQSDFISFTTANYGACYTFNAQIKDNSSQVPRYAILGSSGFHLGLYVHSQQYVPYVADGVGVIALLHNNTEAPLMDYTGLYLSPGFKHKLSYKISTTKYLNSPYGDCTDDVPQYLQGILSSFPNGDYGYSQVLCIQNNLHIYTYQKCGCISPSGWDKRSMVLPGTSSIFSAPVCNVTNTCYTQAMVTYLTSASNSGSNAFKCSKQCSNIDFTVQKSELTTPPDWEMNSIKAFVQNSSVTLPADWSANWSSYIRSNYLSIDVITETSFISTNDQIGSYGISALISDVGGQAGLWLGLSVLILAELFALLYHLIYITYRKIRSKLCRNK